MFEALTERDDRGQVGIGTLIVFIAMVLVAAIAAGVLINTAGVLQSQASDTGSETQESVANQIEVVHASGNVSADGAVDVVNLTVMKSAGSNAIDLSAMTVQYTSSSTDQTLTHGGEVDGVTDLNYPDITSTDGTSYSANDTHFATSDIAGDGNHNELINTDDRVTVSLFIGAIEADDSSNVGPGEGLEGGESATVKLVDQSGAQFSYGVTVPSTFGDKNVVEV